MAGKRVLVVDDEEAVRGLIKAFLHRLGHVVDTAASGAIALQMLEASDYDLLITDLHMPGMNGDVLTREVHCRKPTIPVILVTGARPELIPSDFAHVLAKPFTIGQLRDLAEKVFPKSDTPENPRDLG